MQKEREREGGWGTEALREGLEVKRVAASSNADQKVIATSLLNVSHQIRGKSHAGFSQF